MEIKATLQSPYTPKERMDFIVEYNHNLGYLIQEDETEIKALGYTSEEMESFEEERKSMLCLTSADVERAIYKVKNMDFEDIIAQIELNPPDNLDLKSLKIELKANNFYRGNPYVNIVGEFLGFTSEQLDKFFETNDYTKLVATV